MKNCNEKIFKCSQCNFATVYASSLKSHSLRHAPDTEDRPFQCNICDFSCSRKWYIKKHMKKHGGDKEFKCGKCNFASVHLWSLREHSSRHALNSGPYKCSICDFSCSKGYLKNHMKFHNSNNV